ncbi:MAG: lipoprotein-releasing system ATP-binding protein, partial [Paracoccaceae bacterium]
MSDPVLHLNGITKAYKRGLPGEVNVLRGVDLRIEPGEVVALVAPSGAGKSTLLHIAGLLDAADAGQVAICGQDMTGKGDRARTGVRRRDVGFIYQFHHLLPEFSALENIALPQLANGVSAKDADARALELLDRVGIADRASHRPAALSGGEQQRVAFCRALAN